MKKFIFVSTCAVYGNPIKFPIREDHPVNPLSPYAASKLSAENYCKAFSESYELKTTILRLFNVYGPKQNPSHYSGVITEVINRVREDQSLLIFGDGEQTRDFVFVEDVADVILSAIESEVDGTFNVGTGTSVSVNHLAEVLLKIMNRTDIKLIHADPRLGDVRYSRADISRANRMLDFKPKVTLE